MNPLPGGNGNRRKRVTGVLEHGARGLQIVTEQGDRWVLDLDDVDSGLLGHSVTAEGTLAGLDRLEIDWIGKTAG